MPPVSLAWNGGTEVACAGIPANIPLMATKLAAPMIRIADSIWLGVTLERIGRRAKNGRSFGGDLAQRCCRVALDLIGASLHRPDPGSSGGSSMPCSFSSLKKTGLGAALGVLFVLFAFVLVAEVSIP